MFSPKRRTRLELLVEVLQACIKPAMKTEILYKVRAIHTILSQVLSEAHRKSLVNKSRNRYHITAKGLSFLNKWQELQAFLKEEST